MKRVFIVAALAIVAASVSFAGLKRNRAAQSSRVKQELRRLNQESVDMQVHHDVAAARRLLADDYTFNQADGTVTNKAQNIAVLQDPGFVIESLTTDDLQVRVYGDTALVTGRATMKATYKGQDTGGQFRYMDVWVKRLGRWQNVASQATRLP